MVQVGKNLVFRDSSKKFYADSNGVNPRLFIFKTVSDISETIDIISLEINQNLNYTNFTPIRVLGSRMLFRV